MQELRSSVRFPVRLPLHVGPDHSRHEAETRDISAAGVLFHVDADMAVGSVIHFSINMPASALGTPQDVKISCVGRVVRCAEENGRRAVAAVIDEYNFERP